MLNRSPTAFLLLLLPVLFFSCSRGDEEDTSYRVGILQYTDLLRDAEDGLKEGLAQLEYIEGRNLQYLYRNARGDSDKLQSFAAELVAEKVDLIISITTPATRAAQAASLGTGIPIVFILVSDPVLAGFVESTQHPGGRITGIRDGSSTATGKRLELLQMMTPGIEKVLSVYSGDAALLSAEEQLRSAAEKLGISLIEKQANSTEEAAEIFHSFPAGEADAVFIPSDALVVRAIDEIRALSVRETIPYIFPGGVSDVLASYGDNHMLAGRQGSVLVDKILKGDSPGNIPIELTRDSYFSINLKIVDEIGLTLSDEVLSFADQITR